MSIYLDHAASTPDKTIKYIKAKDKWNGNPHSIHKYGRDAQKILIDAENTIKTEINGYDGTIIWTANGSHANSIAINGTNQDKPVISSLIEHKSILQHKSVSCLLSVDRNGLVNLDDIKYFSNKKSNLISIQLVNNITGIIQSFKKIKKFTKQRYLHIDAIQAFKKIPIDVKEIGCDLMSLSAHKIYGPKGIGCLWIDNNCFSNKKNSFLYPGTPSLELADRFAYAIKKLDTVNYNNRQLYKENIFLDAMKKRMKNYFYIVGFNLDRIPGLFTIIIPGIDQEELFLNLDQEGIYVSIGSACNSNEISSDILELMKVPLSHRKSAIRISIGDTVNVNQLLTTVNTIISIIEKM